jgi:rubrerythrin
MIGKEKVIENLEKAKTIIEKWVPMFEQYNTPFGIDVAIDMLKEQDEEIENLKQTAQSTMEGVCLLKDQDYRTWIIDMFHKYNRDDLIALMVQKGEESLLAGLLKEQEGTINELQNAYSYLQKQFFEVQDELLKEQEAVPVVQREVMHMLVWCCSSCGTAITDGDKFCRMCGRRLKWNGPLEDGE